jgi:hypothetical protein
VPRSAGTSRPSATPAPNPRPRARSCSTCPAPEDATLALTVERLEDGEVSPYLTDELGPGDELELRGPIGGYFVWRSQDGGPLLLVAGRSVQKVEGSNPFSRFEKGLQIASVSSSALASLGPAEVRTPSR